jgi:hypothetical protein
MTRAKEWIEDNIPQGSFIALEYHSPQFFNPLIYWDLSQEARDQIREKEQWLPFFAIQHIPMFSVKPELSAVYYDMALFEPADVIITSSIVKSRYLKEPTRFRRQLAFYNSLESTYDKIAEFQPDVGPGPVLSVYKNPRHEVPFGKRAAVVTPPEVKSSIEQPAAQEGSFYLTYGLNYETFGFFEAALLCYERGLRIRNAAPNVRKLLINGANRCVELLGRDKEAE